MIGAGGVMGVSRGGGGASGGMCREAAISGIVAQAKPLRGRLRHAGLVPASTAPQERKIRISRHGGPRNTSGVTAHFGLGQDFCRGLAQAGLQWPDRPRVCGRNAKLPPSPERCGVGQSLPAFTTAAKAGVQWGDGLWRSAAVPRLDPGLRRGGAGIFADGSSLPADGMWDIIPWGGIIGSADRTLHD